MIRDIDKIRRIRGLTIRGIKRRLRPYLWKSGYSDMQTSAPLWVFTFTEVLHKDINGERVRDSNRVIWHAFDERLHCLQGFYHDGTIDAHGGGCVTSPFDSYPVEDLVRLEAWLIRFLNFEVRRNLAAQSLRSKA